MIAAILVFVLILTLFIGANIYVPFRMAKLFRLQRKKILYILFAAGAVSFPLSMILHRSMANTITGLYYLISTTWMGLFLFLLIFLLVFEVLKWTASTAYKWQSPKNRQNNKADFFPRHLQGINIKNPSRTFGLVIIGFAVLVSLYALWNANSFKVSQVDIPLKGLKNELKIVHISDVHIDDFRGKNYLEKIVRAANEQKPDLVLITGDIIDGKHALTEDIFSPLKKLKAPAYFTTGNHESYANLDKTLEILAKSNVRILRNEIIETHDIQLIGLDYMNADPDSFEMHKVNQLTMKEVLPTLNISADKPTVLMHHSPIGLEYVNQRGITLMLSGHTHGGQILPVSYIGRLFFPYNKGLYNYKGTYIYVSQGAGTFGPRMRLGTNNEITLIRLKKKNLFL